MICTGGRGLYTTGVEGMGVLGVDVDVLSRSAAIKLTRLGVVAAERTGVTLLDDCGLRPGRNFLGGGGLLKLGVLTDGAGDELPLIPLIPRSSGGNRFLDDPRAIAGCVRREGLRLSLFS